MATPSFGFDSFYSTTLSNSITSSDTTIPVTSPPTATEGVLVIEPNSSTNREIIYYTSVSGSNVICPSVGSGRGQEGTTAVAHSSGVVVKMNTTSRHFEVLQDGTALTGLHTHFDDGFYDYVASGCVWSGDSYGSTRAASMTSGVVYINGRKHTVSAVTARTFTASTDTYVDLIYSTTDNVATPVYTPVSNNAASPALASNSIRIAIIITGASSIADAGSVNQGQVEKLLPIASSVPYAVTDSLGNMICNRSATPTIIGARQITSNFTNSTSSAAQITGLSCPVIVPSSRRVEIEVYSGAFQPSANIGGITIWSGTVGSGTQIGQGNGQSGNQELTPKAITQASGSITFNAGQHNSGSSSTTFGASSVQPGYIIVRLV